MGFTRRRTRLEIGICGFDDRAGMQRRYLDIAELVDVHPRVCVAARGANCGSRESDSETPGMARSK